MSTFSQIELEMRPGDFFENGDLGSLYRKARKWREKEVKRRTENSDFTTASPCSVFYIRFFFSLSIFF